MMIFSRVLAVASLMICTSIAAAQQAAPGCPPTAKVLRLWEGDAPGALGQKDADIPTLTLFPVDKPGSPFIIVCPGGGYTHLSAREGPTVSQWLNTLGISSGVLKYRLGSDGYRHPCEMQDVQRAIRLVRANATDWKIDPTRVGILGFSAGGHLASTAAVHFDDGQPNATDAIDKQGCRPDVALLLYPVITMGEFAHAGSRRALLGENPAPDAVEFLSSEKQVTEKTPPTFIAQAIDDKAVPIENSFLFAQALHANKVPFELHLIGHGGHGFGMGKDETTQSWQGEAAIFLRNQKFAEAINGDAPTTAPTH